MIIAILVVFGLVLGSFINALVWRLHEGRDFVRERSECVHCHHELAAKDLVPVLSWLWLRGKCRYCHRPISVQYPLVESSTAILFVVSYIFWPHVLHGSETAIFVLWLMELVGLVALLVYDLRWMLLPNKLVFPLMGIAIVTRSVSVAESNNSIHALINAVTAVAIGGGIFYVLFQVSQGKWIGGGDVKLGFLLGLLVGSPSKSLLVIFLAALLGSVVSVPLLASKKLARKSTIPFGPFLIVAGIVVVLWGAHIIDWYMNSLVTTV